MGGAIVNARAAMIEIDGSRGEGGGQLLRSALALSAWRGRPLRIVNIRATRSRPGLKAQHLAAVEMVARSCGAVVSGATLHSSTLVFEPGPVRAGDHQAAVGTAGATALVVQSALPPLWSARGDSRMRVEGGTHVDWAPSSDYLERVFAPAVRRLGLALDVQLIRRGFYPRGGGVIEARLAGTSDAGPEDQPAGEGRARNDRPAREQVRSSRVLHWRAPARERIRVEMTGVVSSLPRSIAERMLGAAREVLSRGGWRACEEIVETPGPTGTFLFITVSGPPAESSRAGEEGETIAGGFIALGAPGRRAETIAAEAARECLAFLESGAVVDPHLADQLLLPALVAGVELSFTTSRVSSHLRSNAGTIEAFLGPCIDVAGDGTVAVRSPAR
ncbi:MAG: RNA 3'-terminal phosphate cyclase [Candidatus Eisenbacteria bacterium]